MYFFISENIFTFNSGTEHAQAKRTKLFNTYDYGAIYVTRDYNRFLDRDRASLGLAQDDVLNMYDFYQEATEQPRVEQPLRLLDSLPLDEYHIVSDNPNFSLLEKAGRKVARIDVLPSTVGLVNTVTWYDRFGNTTMRENYDWRGFKSSVDYFHPDGTLAVRKFLSITGKVFLEVAYMQTQNQVVPTMFKLLQHQGQDFRFNSENDLFRFFLNELMLISPESTVISDRRSLDAAVADVQNAASKWAYLHDIHTPQAKNPLKGKLFDVYRTALVERAADFAGILVPTDQQQADLQSRFPELNIQVAPNTYVDEEHLAQVPLTVSDRIDGRIIFVGRLSNEKRPDQAIKVMKRVLQAYPEATLEFRGYPASPEELAKLKKLAADEHLADHIIFGDYVTGDELANVYRRARLLIQTSAGEGFGMNLVEAMSYGTPVISYDINYGVHDLIDDGKNGFIVKNDSLKELADKILVLLSDNGTWAAMSQAAFQKGKLFSAPRMIAAWEQVLP